MKAIERNQRTGTAIDALGCSVVLLKKYIAKQFKRGMSWNNWKTVWELDHIRRLSAFDLLNPKQYAKACHYTNLQPMFIAEHRKKSASERAVTF